MLSKKKKLVKKNDCFNITEVHEKKDNSPILIHFQNGNLKPAAYKDASGVVFRDGDNTTRSTLISVDDTVYHGQEEKDDLYRTVIVDVDRETGTVRLIEVGETSVQEISETQPASDDVASNVRFNNFELIRKFGSKKSQRKMEHEEKMKVNILTVEEQAKNTIANIKVTSGDLLIKDTYETYIPSVNRNADVITDVYNIEDILTKEQVSNIMKEVKNHDCESELAPFLMHIMASRKDETEWKTAFILYVNALFTIYTATVRNISKKAYSPCRYSPTLRKVVMHNFTQMSRGKRTRSLQYKDKSLCYAIVALLLACDFRFDLAPFIDAFKISSSSIAKKIKVIGACIVASGTKKQVVLKLPLTLCSMGDKFTGMNSGKFY